MVAGVIASQDVLFGSQTVHIIQSEILIRQTEKRVLSALILTVEKYCTADLGDGDCRPESQLPADHVPLLQAPVVITHRLVADVDVTDVIQSQAA